MVIQTDEHSTNLSLKSGLVLDGKRMMAEGLKEMLISTGKFNNVSCFCSIQDAAKEISCTLYDFLITDIAFPYEGFYELICDARKRWQGINIVVITNSADINAAQKVFAAGADSFVTKDVGKGELEVAIDKNILGEKYISSDLLSKFAISAATNNHGKLTKREIEIVKCVANGLSIAQTASYLNLSHHTIVTHRRNIMEKLNVNSAVDVARYAFSNNYLSA